MNFKNRFRVYWRFLFFEAKEMLIDLFMIAFPIFTVTGLIVASVAFWHWVFW